MAGTRRIARSFRGRSGPPRRPGARPSPPICTVVSSWPATTWAFVTTRPLPATQPLPCTPSPQAVPSTRTTLRRAARTSGSSAIAGSGARTSGWGPRMPGNGSKRASVLSSGPLGRQRGVELLEDHRALDRLAQLARARGVQGHRSGQPHQPEPDRGHQHRAAYAVERAQPLPEPAAQAKAQHLQRRGQDAADQQRAHQSEQRRVRRTRTLGEEHRPHSRAEEAAGHEPGERECANDQALRVPPDGHDEREGHDDPVDPGHPTAEPSGATGLP